MRPHRLRLHPSLRCRSCSACSDSSFARVPAGPAFEFPALPHCAIVLSPRVHLYLRNWTRGRSADTQGAPEAPAAAQDAAENGASAPVDKPSDSKRSALACFGMASSVVEEAADIPIEGLLGGALGLGNLGNTCFIAAALQCLRMTPGLLEVMAPDLLADPDSILPADPTTPEHQSPSDADPAVAPVPAAAPPGDVDLAVAPACAAAPATAPIQLPGSASSPTAGGGWVSATPAQGGCEPAVATPAIAPAAVGAADVPHAVEETNDDLGALVTRPAANDQQAAARNTPLTASPTRAAGVAALPASPASTQTGPTSGVAGEGAALTQCAADAPGWQEQPAAALKPETAPGVAHEQDSVVVNESASVAAATPGAEVDSERGAVTPREPSASAQAGEPELSGAGTPSPEPESKPVLSVTKEQVAASALHAMALLSTFRGDIGTIWPRRLFADLRGNKLVRHWLPPPQRPSECAWLSAALHLASSWNARLARATHHRAR